MFVAKENLISLTGGGSRFFVFVAYKKMPISTSPKPAMCNLLCVAD